MLLFRSVELSGRGCYPATFRVVLPHIPTIRVLGEARALKRKIYLLDTMSSRWLGGGAVTMKLRRHRNTVKRYGNG